MKTILFEEKSLTVIPGKQKSGVNVVELRTSSENIAMQIPANELGFICVSERRWFSKRIFSPLIESDPHWINTCETATLYTDGDSGYDR